MNSSLISMKSHSSLFVAAAATVAAVAAAVYTERRFRRRRDDDDGKGKKADDTMNFKDGSHESLVNERFQACAKVMGPVISSLPQRTQLDYYGLFKQGTLGDCNEYQSEPPPSYDLVASAKYQAWVRLTGMDRMTAMQNYIDKALHFQFIKNIGDEDDQDYELEGDAVIDMMGLGDKPSTLADEFDKDAMALEDSQYPIHAAAREGKSEELKTLLESAPTTTTSTSTSTSTSPNTLDVSGQTPLHLATDRGHIECVKILVLAGADIHSVDHDGISILQAAVIGGDKECCKLLLILGANPDQADHDGDTPRDSAEDDTELKELFQNYDDKTLLSEQLLDITFLKELQHRKIPIAVPIQTTTTAAASTKANGSSSNANSSAKPEKVDVKQEMKILDEAIDVDLDDDGDMF